MRANPEFETDRSAHAWLFRTATNLARNEMRRRRLLAFVPFSGRESATGGGFDFEADHVRTALRSLPFEQATSLLLHYHAGFQRHEIAHLQGVSEETVKSRLARGRKGFTAAYRRLARGLVR
jgi:RNA polymerase sigma-70 factor (ECF subfamily)